MLEKELLQLLVCPQTGGRLLWLPDQAELVSLAARCAYPVKQGVPILLKEQARPIHQEEYESIQRR